MVRRMLNLSRAEHVFFYKRYWSEYVQDKCIDLLKNMVSPLTKRGKGVQKVLLNAIEWRVAPMVSTELDSCSFTLADWFPFLGNQRTEALNEVEEFLKEK